MTLKLMFSGRQTAQGEAAPWWYGVAYHSCCDDHIICYPVPINLIVRWARSFWWLLKRGKTDALAKAYHRGRTHGYQVGKDTVDKGQQEAVDYINRWAALHRTKEKDDANNPRNEG